MLNRLWTHSKVSDFDVAGIGIGAPGPQDFDAGMILDPPNLAIRNFPLRVLLEKEFKIPAVLDNDVNAGLYGEFRQGAAKGFRHAVGVFPGTGVGGGLILDGRLYGGATGNAGEIGHMTIMAGAPESGVGVFPGTVEALASRTMVSSGAAA